MSASCRPPESSCEMRSTGFALPHPIVWVRGGGNDLVRPHGHLLEQQLAVGRHHRHVHGVATARDDYTPDPACVVAGVKRPPPSTAVDLHPGAAVPRPW